MTQKNKEWARYFWDVYCSWCAMFLPIALIGWGEARGDPWWLTALTVSVTVPGALALSWKAYPKDSPYQQDQPK